MIKEAIGKLVIGQSLDIEESARVMEEIMEGQATASQLAAFLTALRIKGETAEELTGLARVMRARAVQVDVAGPLLDIVGTGGDGLNTFNISTAAAFVAAGAGIRVAKHGNRAASSQCGSADVLEKLGVAIDLNASQIQSCIREVGIGFLFAQTFHPAMKYAAPTRREIGFRTVFNILGPLTNPSRAEYQVIGVASPELVDKMVRVLVYLGTKHAVVVHGKDGMDEISICGQSTCCEVKNGHITHIQILPQDFGLKSASLESIRGGTAEQNARTVLGVLSGTPGPERDVVVLNAAAALLAAEKADSLEQGVAMAGKIIDDGRAMAKLKKMAEFTRHLKEI